MSSVFQSLTAGCVGLALVCGSASIHAAQPGFLEGHLKILPLREVELADADNTTTTPQAYAEYPLVVLSRDGKREIARLTADADGHYRAELPPGDYVLDVQDRARKHLRARPKSFTIVSDQTVRIDMDVDTGVR
jgi:hypothetical protein